MERKFVDLQINGNMGVDFSDPTLTEDMFMKAADQIFKSGTSLFLPTIVTSPKEVYLRNLAVIRSACEKHDILKNVPGVHLEGPFISDKPIRPSSSLSRTVRFLMRSWTAPAIM